MENADKVIEALADKLGVGAQYLIQTLAAGVYGQAVGTLLGIILVGTVIFIGYRVHKNTNYEDSYEGETASRVVSILISVAVVFWSLVTACALPGTIMALTAPESWALWEIVDKIGG